MFLLLKSLFLKLSIINYVLQSTHEQNKFNWLKGYDFSGLQINVIRFLFMTTHSIWAYFYLTMHVGDEIDIINIHVFKKITDCKIILITYIEILAHHIEI